MSRSINLLWHSAEPPIHHAPGGRRALHELTQSRAVDVRHVTNVEDDSLVPCLDQAAHPAASWLAPVSPIVMSPSRIRTTVSPVRISRIFITSNFRRRLRDEMVLKRPLISAQPRQSGGSNVDERELIWRSLAHHRAVRQ